MRQSDFVSEVRQLSTTLIQTINGMNALRTEWDGLDYGNTLDDEGSDAFDGANSDVTSAEVAAVIGTTLDALNGLMAAGHRTNLLHVRT